MAQTGWLILPTFNEAENIGPIVAAAVAALEVCASEGFRVLIVDDSSPDGTGELADDLAATHATVEVLHRATREGLGPAYLAGFRHALDAGALVLVVPTVDTLEEAIEARNWTYFPPLGKRSQGGGQAFSPEFWGSVPGGYRNTINDNVVLIEMIETLDGLKVAYAKPSTLASLAAARLAYGSSPWGHAASGTPTISMRASFGPTVK